jgi:hypothetical protein
MSPGGAAGNSQACKRLEASQWKTLSPNGATHALNVSPRWGSVGFPYMFTRGSHPWLLPAAPPGLI